MTLTRKTPMKQGSKPMKRTAMARGASTLQRGGPIKARQVDRAAPAPKKSRGPGLKGRTPTAAERRFMDQAGAVPCLACEKDGRINHAISLHHVDGRTKPGAHYRVLPLCAPHHQQDDTDPLQRPSVHERKATFTERYGTEGELLQGLYERLSFTPPE